MRGLRGATLATIDAVGSLILDTAPRGVTGMGRDRDQVPRLPPAPTSWFTPSQALTWTTGMAVASRRGWQCVRATPRYRIRRRSKRRPPCDRRLPTPARSAYCAVNAGVSWRCRAA